MAKIIIIKIMDNYMKNKNCKKKVLIIVSGRSGTVGGPRVSSNRIVNSGLAKKYNFSLLEVPRLRRLIMPKSIYTTMKKINEFRPDLIQVNGLQLDGFIITVLIRIIAGNKILLAIRGSSNEAIYYSKLLKSMTKPLEILTILLSYKVFTNSIYL